MAFARQRRSAYQRGYDADWIRMRLRILDRDGWTCQVPTPDGTICGADLTRPDVVATVDHIIELAERPDLRLDPANLRAACRSCNNSRGATYGNRRRLNRTIRRSVDW